jgi:hypothetical protein
VNEKATKLLESVDGVTSLERFLIMTQGGLVDGEFSRMDDIAT